ncbi:RidA family protein [Cellulomonas sp. RIT-PI-Y]|uniref:RidA family protein n=1 Tax=Cellulomonas sp. RIT-PI-Y TaxID=3035297 RepID=UPI0021DA861D|nr:RidA family protein [Cellulomonas sp. RIT-PI-Y]
MSVHRFSPAGLQPHTPYAHVAVAEGARHIHISGQIARDSEGDPVGGDDLGTQVEQTLRNTHRALAGADASFADVVRMTFYVTRWSPAQIGDFMAGVERVAGELGIPQPLPPASLIGVDHLFEPDVRVELEVTAIAA